jgi:hypothetical protein
VRVIYIPSDRPAEDSIRDAIEEARVVQDSADERYLFLLIEHGREHEGRHAELLGKLAAGGDVGYLQLTRDRWDALLAALLDACSFTTAVRERLRRLLSPEGVSYSSGPNKCFLLAAALGVTVVHRRDSDQVADVRDGHKVFPGVPEAAVIGKPVTGLPGLGSDAGAAFAEHATVRFAGSSLLGDAGHDRRDLLAAGEDHAVSLERLSRPWLTPGEARTAVHMKFVAEPPLRYEEDFWNTDGLARVSVGLSCVQDIFYELPEMPIESMLGSDYFQKSVLGALGYPVIFHSRKMRHTYEQVRSRNTDLPTVTSYALRDLRNVMFLPVRNALCEQVRNGPDAVTDETGRLRQDRLADCLETAYRQHAMDMREIPRRYSEIYAAAAGDAAPDIAVRLRTVAEASACAQEAVIDDIQKGVEDYSLLIRSWKELMGNADTLRPQILGLMSALVPP